MIEMMVCPQCAGYGLMLDSEEPCAHCKGWGLLHVAEVVCPTCQGKKTPSHLKCTGCGNKGVISKVAVMQERVHGDVEFKLIDSITPEQIKSALTILRVGYEETEPVSPKVLGRLAVLLEMSAEMDGSPFKDWIREDRIVFEPSGIWIVRGDTGCRVHEYEVRH